MSKREKPAAAVLAHAAGAGFGWGNGAWEGISWPRVWGNALMHRSVRQRTLDEARTASALKCDIALTIAVPDPARLWDEAMAHLRGSGLDLEEILETIGDRADPQIEDCLAVLLLPDRIAGCDLLSFGLRQDAAQDGGTEATQ